jgi:hypothetical protein
MSYRLNTHVKPLIWIESVIERHDHSRYWSWQLYTVLSVSLLAVLWIRMLILSFWASRIRNRHYFTDPDLDPVPDPYYIKQRKSEKIQISTVL